MQVFTRSISFLSSLLAQNSNIKYTPSIPSTVAKHTGFSAKLAKPANALLKSMGFGATKNPPANETRFTTLLIFLIGLAIPGVVVGIAVVAGYVGVVAVAGTSVSSGSLQMQWVLLNVVLGPT